MTTDELKNASDALHTLLSQGKFLEAMDEFLHDDVVLQEANEATKRGKKLCMDLEAKVLEDVATFGGYRVSNVGFGDDTVFYQAVMEYTQTDGKEVRVDQCVVDTWRDGKIVSERFYHA
jgi:ketosteroid isomerase-like protein